MENCGEKAAGMPLLRLLTLQQVMDMTGLSASLIYNLMGRGLFPLCVKATDRTSRWFKHEVEAWALALPRAVIGNTK